MTISENEQDLPQANTFDHFSEGSDHQIFSLEQFRRDTGDLLRLIQQVSPFRKAPPR